jgi:hypothetical protein
MKKVQVCFLVSVSVLFGWLTIAVADPAPNDPATADWMEKSYFQDIRYVASNDTIGVDTETYNAPESGTAHGFGQELLDGFKWRFNTLGFGIYQKPETDSVVNANNRLNINRYQAEIDLRPDFELTFRRLEMSIKPRWEFTWKKWADGGINDGDDEFDERLFVNEWLVRFMAVEQLFLSYGRENLQWGPSYLISPSNPFNKNNGKDNPKIEVPGLDYGRAVWIPSYSWTVSFIANTDEGEEEFFREFDPTYALKIDYTGSDKYFSLIPSYRESGDYQLGFFGRWSATDAFLIWGEGNVLLDTDDEDLNSGDVKLLVGSSYTLEIGPTLTLEYYYNESGCTDAVQECIPPVGNANLDDILIRKNYLLAQYVDTNVWDALDIVVRFIWDLDDNSNRTIGIFEYEINNYVNLFAIGNYYSGNGDDEFGSILNYSIFAGVELTI